MEVNHRAENYPNITIQVCGHSVYTTAEIKEEVNPSKYVANEPLPPVPPQLQSLLSHTGIEGGDGYLEPGLGSRSPPPEKDCAAVNG